MKTQRVKALVAWCFCAALLFASVRELRAHAILVETFPNSGATVSGPDVTIRLKFNVRIDAERSRLTLVRPAGLAKQLTLGTQPSPDILTTSATGLIAGKYKLQWQVLAADGHISRGEIAFSVQ